MKPDLPFVALAAGKHATNWQLAPQLAPGNHIGKHQRDTLPAALILKSLKRSIINPSIELFGGEGEDTIQGGDGQDEIFGGTDIFPSLHAVGPATSGRVAVRRVRNRPKERFGWFYVDGARRAFQQDRITG